MTRDEIIETYMINSKKVIAEMLHDTINRYELRICENCKHLHKSECMEIHDWDCYNDAPSNWSPPKDFGCNKFVAKDMK